MKDAVTARNAFAAAHSSYITLLKNTGAALNDYGQGETTEIRAPGVPAHPQILDPPLAPPPLPFPSPTRFLDSGPIKRSISMPPIALQEASAEAAAAKMISSPPRKSTIREDEEDTEEEAEREENPVETPATRPPPPPLPRVDNPPPPPPPAQDRTWDFFDVFSHNTYNSGHNAPTVEEVETGEDAMHSKSEIRQISEDEVALDGHVEDDEHMDDDTDAHDSPAKTPEKIVQRNHSNKVAEPAVVRKEEMPMSLTVSKGGVKDGGGKDLLEVLQEIDDQFLKASESGQEVSKMLEANRLHYHSNFADNKGMIDPDRVKRAITWNRSFKLPSSEDGNDNSKEEKESHASVLDKLLAWEKKLYDEVKAGELMKIEYQKKIALLNKQKKRGRNSEGLEKTKAAVKYLHTRYMVDFQAMDSTSSEIKRLRDDQLYPHLVYLVAGMAKMWKSMYDSHCKQQEIVAGLRNIDISNAPEETTKQHYERTVQLHNVVNEWQSQSSKLVRFQKEYINALNSWLRLNLVPIESNLKEKVSSPQRTVMPPIHGLLQKWHNELDKLPETVVLEAIKSFAAIVDRILKQQEEERKQKIKYEEAKVEHEKKRRAYEEWHQRYMEKKIPGENGSEPTGPDQQIEERVNQLEMLRKKVEEEKEKHKKSCNYTRILSINSLKTGLPAVFEGMVGFARVCSEVYKNLQSQIEDA
ncbi:hypothetical protein SUGI_0790170 [Cryptomeria japonica]|nr:hypothetical protein SUGI_0790170 [Cryptomeria japonica]